MKKFRLYKTNGKSIIPKISRIYNGYHGFNNGLALYWKNKMFVLVLPINER